MKNINVLEWPSQSLDLKPTEKPMGSAKEMVRRKTPQAYMSWRPAASRTSSPEEACSNFPENYKMRLLQVIKNKGRREAIALASVIVSLTFC